MPAAIDSDTDSDSDSDSDSDTSSDSGSDAESEGNEVLVKGALFRSYLRFTVSQDPKNQSFLSPSQFSKLDLYQIDALRDEDDPLALRKEMQGATRHFPCHVFWSRDMGKRGYAVWGRPTVGQHEQEAVIRMLEEQREEREEYVRLVCEKRWQQECERKMQALELKSSAARAVQRADDRRRLARRERRVHWDPSTTGRVASIVHRIHRSRGDEPMTTSEAEGLINRGLTRLGKEALVTGGFALVSAVTYLASLQQSEDGQGGLYSLLGRLGILPETTHLATRAGGSGSTSVTDRVFAAHARRDN